MLQLILGKKYLPSVALSYLNVLLMDAIFGARKHLLVSWPPRHGKSELCSHALPAWFLGMFPDRRVMLGSYEASFAGKWGRRTRDTLMRHGRALYGIRVRDDASLVTGWEIAEHGGGMDTAGVGGAFTGKGGNLIVVDDPVKNAEEAMSKVYRDKTWEWFDSTVLSRQEPNATVVVIMQRWHMDDLIGRVLREQPGMWREVNFPALAEGNDALGRREGEALFPARFTREMLEQKRATTSAYFWSAQYQQRPAPAEGTLFLRENWKRLDKVPDGLEVVLSADCAFKDSKDSNPVSIQAWGKKGPDFYLIDRTHGRMGFSATIQAIRDMKRAWPKARAILVEDKANGPAVIEVLRKEITGVIAVEPKGGKWTRANAVEPAHRSGNVWIIEKPWAKDVIEEAASFPTGATDDDVDAMTQAINWYLDRPNPGIMAVG